MERLTRRDSVSLLELLEESYALADLDDFVHLVCKLLGLVGSDLTGYNEVNLRRRRTAFFLDPRIRLRDSVAASSVSTTSSLDPLRADYRAALGALRPHLARAYRNADRLTELGQGLLLVIDGIGANGTAVVRLTQNGRLENPAPAPSWP